MNRNRFEIKFIPTLNQYVVYDRFCCEVITENLPDYQTAYDIAMEKEGLKDETPCKVIRDGEGKT